MIKQIMIPVAAFAVTATGASAFNSDILESHDVSLTDTQIEVLEEAHELRHNGTDRTEIKEMFEAAGLDQETLQKIRTITREYRDEMHEAVKKAIDNEDYDAYLEAVADTPRADLIDSESDFEKLLEAHELREDGDHEGVREILSELGFEKPEGRGHKGGMRSGDGEGRGFGGPGFQKGDWQSAE